MAEYGEEYGDRDRGWRERLTARKWPLVVAGVLLALVIGGMLALKLVFPPERLRAMVVPRLEAAVDREVRLGGVQLRIFPRIAVRLEDLAIANAEGFGDEPMLELAALDVRPRLLPLLRGEMELRELRLLRPLIRYQVDAAGRSNLEGLGGPDEEPAADGREVGLLVIADLTIRDGRLFYTNAQNGRAARVGRLEGDLSSEGADGAQALTSSGELRFEDIRLLLPDRSEDSISVPRAGLEYEVFVDVTGDSAAVRELDLRLGDLTLEGGGAVYELSGEPRYDLSFRSGEVDIERLLTSLPPDYRPQTAEPSGRAQVSLEVRSEAAEDGTPPISGTLELSDLSVDYGGAAAITGGAGRISFTPETLRVASFESQLFGRPFEARATLTNFDDPQVDARVTGALDLEQLAELRAMESEMRGVVSIDLQATGPLRRPAAMNVTGPVRLSNVEYRSGALDVPARIESGTLRFATSVVNVEELPIRLGESDLRVTATGRNLVPLAFGAVPEAATPSLEFRAASSRFDVGEVLSESEVGYGNLLAARLANRDVEGRDPGDIARGRYGDLPLPPIELSGRVTIDELVNPPTTARNVAFRVTSGEGRLQIHDLSGEVYGGDLGGTVTLELGDGRPPYPLSYELSIRGGQAQTVLERWTRLGAAMEGTLDFSIDGRSQLDETMLPVREQTDAQGRAVFRDGRFADFAPIQRLARELRIDPEMVSSFRRLGGAYRIEGAAFRLQDWELTTGDLRGTVGGALGFGGNLDLEMELTVPSSLIRQLGGSGDGLGQALNTLIGQRDSLELALDIGGTVAEPVVQLDMQALQRQLETGAEDLLQRLFRPPR